MIFSRSDLLVFRKLRSRPYSILMRTWFWNRKVNRNGNERWITRSAFCVLAVLNFDMWSAVLQHFLKLVCYKFSSLLGSENQWMQSDSRRFVALHRQYFSNIGGYETGSSDGFLGFRNNGGLFQLRGDECVG